MKTIYLIRHSKSGDAGFIYKLADAHTKNVKRKLTKEGINIAKDKISDKEFDDVEEIYSSEYLRCKQTAKILAARLDKKIIVNKDFNERKVGVTSFQSCPSDFEEKQFADFDYKLDAGESLNEVNKRISKAFSKVVKESKAKKIAIFSHGTALMVLLKNWCEIADLKNPYYFNGKEIFAGRWHYCETFKVVLNDKNEIVTIENI